MRHQLTAHLGGGSTTPDRPGHGHTHRAGHHPGARAKHAAKRRRTIWRRTVPRLHRQRRVAPALQQRTVARPPGSDTNGDAAAGADGSHQRRRGLHLTTRPHAAERCYLFLPFRQLERNAIPARRIAAPKGDARHGADFGTPGTHRPMDGKFHGPRPTGIRRCQRPLVAHRQRPRHPHARLFAAKQGMGNGHPTRAHHRRRHRPMVSAAGGRPREGDKAPHQGQGIAPINMVH